MIKGIGLGGKGSWESSEAKQPNFSSPFLPTSNPKLPSVGLPTDISVELVVPLY